MIGFLHKLLRRVATVAALLFGALLAVLFATLTLVATLAIGATVWLANRFGMRATPASPPPAAARGQDVIDVEMREIEPGERADRPGASAEDSKRA